MNKTELFKNWVDEVVIKQQPSTNGMPLCPYAGKAMRDGKVVIEEFAYDCTDLSPILEKVAWTATHPQFDVVVLIHPEIPCDAKCHRKLEDMLRPLALRLGLQTFSYHPDDPTSIGGVLYQMPVCALQFQPATMVEEMRRKLMKTKYYDKFTVAELKDLNFFENMLLS